MIQFHSSKKNNLSKSQVKKLPLYYRKQVEEQARKEDEKHSNRSSGLPANKKPNKPVVKEVSVEIYKGEKLLTPVCIHVHQILKSRGRRKDMDGFDFKGCLDAIIDSELLPDDGEKYIPGSPVFTAEYF